MMLSKDEVLVWFKDLKGSCRVDVMCRLLRCCAVLELRYLYSVAEGLLGDSFEILNQAELQANHLIHHEGIFQKQHPCSGSHSLTQVQHRANCLTTLALLRHDNYAVAHNVLYPILSAVNPDIVQTAGDFKVVDEVQLLMYMAANHPSFSVSERKTLWDKVKQMQRLGLSSDARPLSADAERSPLLKESTVIASKAHKSIESSPVLGSDDVVIPDTLVVTGYRKNGKIYEFIMEVTWSDGRCNQIYKSHDELFQFQNTLLNKFPEAAGNGGGSRIIPYLPGKKILALHKGELAEKRLPEIAEYARSFTQLPREILASPHVIDFFGANSVNDLRMTEDIDLGYYSSTSLPSSGLQLPVEIASHSYHGYWTSLNQSANDAFHRQLAPFLYQPPSAQTSPAINNAVQGYIANAHSGFDYTQSRPNHLRRNSSVQPRIHHSRHAGVQRGRHHNRHHNFQPANAPIVIQSSTIDSLRGHARHPMQGFTVSQLPREGIQPSSINNAQLLPERQHTMNNAIWTTHFSHPPCPQYTEYKDQQTSPSCCLPGSSTAQAMFQQPVHCDCSHHTMHVPMSVSDEQTASGLHTGECVSLQDHHCHLSVPALFTSDGQKVCMLGQQVLYRKLANKGVDSSSHDGTFVPSEAGEHGEQTDFTKNHSSSVGHVASARSLPALPYCSASSHSSRKAGEVRTFDGLIDWLKALRLHKYSSAIGNRSFRDVISMTEVEIDSLGMTDGARRRFQIHLDWMRSSACETFSLLSLSSNGLAGQKQQTESDTASVDASCGNSWKSQTDLAESEMTDSLSSSVQLDIPLSSISTQDVFSASLCNEHRFAGTLFVNSRDSSGKTCQGGRPVSGACQWPCLKSDFCLSTRSLPENRSQDHGKPEQMSSMMSSMLSCPHLSVPVSSLNIPTSHRLYSSLSGDNNHLLLARGKGDHSHGNKEQGQLSNGIGAQFQPSSCAEDVA